MTAKRRRLSGAIGRLSSVWMVGVADFCYRSRLGFYWALAAALSVGVLISTALGLSLVGAAENTLDGLIKARWSSPAPSDQVVILDIDERSLAKLAPSLGRWPWKREVLAEAISEIEGAGAKAVIFNVLVTDPDISNRQSDAVLDSVAAGSSVVAFPFVRLPAANDGKSELRVSQISGATKDCEEDPTVAAILPGMPGMRAHMGISNLEGDEDGILRRYGLVRQESCWSMPTLIGQALKLAGTEPKAPLDSSYLLNWRNKKEDYRRISFVELYETLSGVGSMDLSELKGKYVILGASAPGISATKATSASNLADDNAVLANALDDAVQGSYLRPVSPWLMAAMSIVFLIVLAWMFNRGRANDQTDAVFAAIETGSVAVMFLTISYTNYYVDLSPLATYGLVFFTVAKVHQSFAGRVISGSPEHLGALVSKNLRQVAVLTFRDADGLRANLVKTYPKLVKLFGDKSVFLCFDVFGGDNVLGGYKDVGCLVVVTDESEKDAFSSRLRGAVSEAMTKRDFGIHPLSGESGSIELLAAKIGQKVLEEASKLEVA